LGADLHAKRQAVQQDNTLKRILEDALRNFFTSISCSRADIFGGFFRDSFKTW
jgi:hypothetical protein